MYFSDYTSRPLRQRNVRFEDTVSTGTAQRMEDFKKVLQKEKDLQGLKNKVCLKLFFFLKF